jgi:hypothetical protein
MQSPRPSPRPREGLCAAVPGPGPSQTLPDPCQPTFALALQVAQQNVRLRSEGRRKARISFVALLRTGRDQHHFSGNRGGNVSAIARVTPRYAMPYSCGAATSPETDAAPSQPGSPTAHKPGSKSVACHAYRQFERFPFPLVFVAVGSATADDPDLALSLRLFRGGHGHAVASCWACEHPSQMPRPRDLGNRPPFRQEVRNVCGDCNHGWMSRLERVRR